MDLNQRLPQHWQEAEVCSAQLYIFAHCAVCTFYSLYTSMHCTELHCTMETTAIPKFNSLHCLILVPLLHVVDRCIASASHCRIIHWTATWKASTIRGGRRAQSNNYDMPMVVMMISKQRWGAITFCSKRMDEDSWWSSMMKMYWDYLPDE